MINKSFVAWMSALSVIVSGFAMPHVFANTQNELSDVIAFGPNGEVVTIQFLTSGTNGQVSIRQCTPWKDIESVYDCENAPGTEPQIIDWDTFVALSTTQEDLLNQELKERAVALSTKIIFAQKHLDSATVSALEEELKRVISSASADLNNLPLNVFLHEVRRNGDLVTTSPNSHPQFADRILKGHLYEKARISNLTDKQLLELAFATEFTIGTCTLKGSRLDKEYYLGLILGTETVTNVLENGNLLQVITKGAEQILAGFRAAILDGSCFN